LKGIEGMQPKVALDVENYALSVLNENLKHEMFNDIKDYIFTLPNPVSVTDEAGASASLDIRIESILLIMSIYLRDKYFASHSEINVQHFFEKKEEQLEA
jgi:hypothetical protein